MPNARPLPRIAIITARGGSKRIPNKNRKQFCGKPILAYAIQAAQDSHVFQEVMVSTDDPKIAQIALSYGATVPFMRTEKTADDFATTADVLLEVLSMYRAQSKEFSAFCCIYPTAVFATGSLLAQAMDKLETEKADAVIPVVRYSYPPQRAYVLQDGFIKRQYPEYETARSQDLEPIYHDAGQFYAVDTAAFLTQKTLALSKAAALILPESAVQDIDTVEDWALAELKFEKMNGAHKCKFER